LTPLCKRKTTNAKAAVFNLFNISSTLGNIVVFCQFVIRELQCKLPQYLLFEIYQKHFLFYQRVLAQKPKDKNKIYSLHEPDVYVIAKGKDRLRAFLGKMMFAPT
jgi:hypothetical protein